MTPQKDACWEDVIRLELVQTAVMQGDRVVLLLRTMRSNLNTDVIDIVINYAPDELRIASLKLLFLQDTRTQVDKLLLAHVELALSSKFVMEGRPRPSLLDLDLDSLITSTEGLTCPTASSEEFETLKKRWAKLLTSNVDAMPANIIEVSMLAYIYHQLRSHA